MKTFLNHYRRALAALCGLMLSLTASEAAGVDGTLDPSFNGTGKVTSDFNGDIKAMAIQSDGKIVVAGSAVVGNNRYFALARYTSTGALDTSFGTNGLITTDFGGIYEIANAVAIQADGMIVLAGLIFRSTGFDVALARYTSTGALDTSFGTSGKVTTDFFGFDDAATGVVIQADGKIVVAGYAGTASGRDFGLARYTSTGALDASFGSNGKVTTDFKGGTDDAYAVAIQSDGKIVACGDAGDAFDFALARYTATGALDTSFGTNGKVTTDFNRRDDFPLAIALQPDGKIVLAGYTTADDFALARYTSTGALDTSFGTNGKVTTDFNASNDDARAVAIQPDGNIVVAGFVIKGSFTTSDFGLARYTSTGALDTSFGTNGKLTTDFGGDADQAYALAIQKADGKIVAAGFTFKAGASHFALARYGAAIATPTTLANISTRLSVQTGDNVLIGGFIVTGTQAKKVILRAIGPSLPFAGKLTNPTLELRNSASALVDSNDDWMTSPNKQAIIDSTIPPSNDMESAIVASLAANNSAYTAIVRGVNNETGIGVVEAYDLDRTVDSKLANISTRGLVGTGDNVMIAGTIVVGQGSQKVIVRGIGPSLSVPGKLPDPTLELRDGNGALLEANDNWKDSPNKQAIIDSTIPPSNDLESAIVRTLAPGNYTAIVRGVNGTTGVALVEVYALN